jgi:hypothetical protein
VLLRQQLPRDPLNQPVDQLQENQLGAGKSDCRAHADRWVILA